MCIIQTFISCLQYKERRAVFTVLRKGRKEVKIRMTEKIDLAGNPFYLTGEQIKWVEDAYQKLTVKQKIGQLFCVMGQDYSIEELTNMAAEQGVGAVLYRPAPSEEIRENYARLDEAAPVPLLKAANLEEGGAGGTAEGTLFGWPMMVAATDDLSMAEKFAQVCAAEGREIGINWTFSPVSDLDLNFRNPITNVRSYGSSLKRVMAFTEVYMKTVQECGVAACAKHFPGDGVDFRDHHLHPTYNSLSSEEWYASYGRIYQNMIDKGLLSIMAGHIVQPNVAMRKNPDLTIGQCLPASQSRELLTGVLREEFHFNGVITTDATIMGGYCMTMPRREAIVASVMAGSDMLVFNTDFQEDYQYMMDALESGALTEERLNEAVLRVLALKAAVCQKVFVQPETDARGWHRECADKAVTLVKDIQHILPVTTDKYSVIRLIVIGKDDIRGKSMTTTAVSYLEQEGFRVEVYEPLRDDLHGSKGLPGDRLTLYLANMETASNQTTVRIGWCPKHALEIPRFVMEEDAVFVSFANPYHLQDIPRIRTYINAYTATEDSIYAVLDKIMGKSEFKGVSPVDAFCGLTDTRL